MMQENGEYMFILDIRRNENLKRLTKLGKKARD